MPDNQYKTCSAHDLATASAGGWDLHQVVYEDTKISDAMPMNAWSQQANGSVPCGVIQPVIVRRPIFVLSRTEDAAREELAGEMAALRETETKQLVIIEGLKRETERLERALAVQAERAECYQRSHVSCVERLAVEEDKGRALETDIGKVREAVGAIRMREIIGR